MSRVRAAIDIIRRLKNFPLFFANHIGVIRRKNIVYRLRNGIRFNARPKTHDSRVIVEIWNNEYTPPGFEIKPGDLVVDIGAHIGVFAIFASTFTRNKILAVEPLLENFEILKANIRMNKIGNIIPINKAITDKRGLNEFSIFEGMAHPLCRQGGGPLEQTVVFETITLKDLMSEGRISQIDFLKMDCEGWEYDIILQCETEILRKINKISMECHHIDKDRQSTILKNILEEKGFQVNIKIIKPEEFSMIYATKS
jgi:FkbM family methyltransferase